MSITLTGLTKSFDATAILRGIDLQIAKGDLVALLGPSGSGKTTLLKIIAGLDWPDAGQLEVEGQDWLRLSAQERRIGFVFQSYALFPHMTVAQNISFGLSVRPRALRPGRQAIEQRVAQLLTLLQIPHLAGRYPTQLSGGQRQRVALGRALAIEPAVLLLDEPFGALDAAIRRDLRLWLREVHEQTASTTLFVTHDQQEAFELADRIVVLNEGRIEQIGSADQIHDHPASPFVARFMGAVVELPVQIRAGRVSAPGLDASLLERRVLADGPATLFLRPDQIQLQPDPDSPYAVTRRFSTGTELHLQLRGPQGQSVPVDLPRLGGPAIRLAEGCRVQLRPLAGAVFASPTSQPPAMGAQTATPHVAPPVPPIAPLGAEGAVASTEPTALSEIKEFRR